MARYFGPEDRLLLVPRPDGGHTAVEAPMYENIVEGENAWVFLFGKGMRCLDIGLTFEDVHAFERMGTLKAEPHMTLFLRALWVRERTIFGRKNERRQCTSDPAHPRAVGVSFRETGTI